MKEKNKPLTAGADDAGKRLDRVLRRAFPDLALSGVYRLLRRGRVTVNGRPADPAYRLSAGDRIEVAATVGPPGGTPDRPPPDAARARRRLRALILFRNEHVLALNKPYGTLVHGPGSLAELVAAGFPPASPSLSFRPGPVHRLDRNTSGVQVFGLSLTGARELSRIFHAHGVRKIYCAAVEGTLDRPAEWSDRLVRDRAARKTVAAGEGGSDAVTSVVPLLSSRGASLVFFLPKTGRTHQLRFQAAQHGHPLLGDKKYGGPAGAHRLLLHCLGLAFIGSELALPSFFAPFDRLAAETMTALFGKETVELVNRRGRELLRAP